MCFDFNQAKVTGIPRSGRIYSVRNVYIYIYIMCECKQTKKECQERKPHEKQDRREVVKIKEETPSPPLPQPQTTLTEVCPTCYSLMPGALDELWP